MQVTIFPKPTGHIEISATLQQTSFWAGVKEHLGCPTLAFNIRIRENRLAVKRDSDKNLPDATDDLLVVLHPVGQKRYIAHIPYGPVIEPAEELQGSFLEELSEGLRTQLPPGCILIRYDLRWESYWAHDHDRFDGENKWLGPPAPVIQEMRLNYNTITHNLRKTWSDNLPSSTIFINLRNDRESLLKNMKPKTRYNIQLAQRKGVTVKEAGTGQLGTWYELYKQTTSRNGIFLQGIEYFESIIRAQEEQADVRLLIAEADRIPLATMFLTVAGGRATYLYGASSSAKRHLMGTYALQWEAIKTAKEKGCVEYDMFGISQPARPSHPLYGLYRFKTGFGGYIYRRMGCWDYPLDKAAYEVFRSVEMNSTGYHLK